MIEIFIKRQELLHRSKNGDVRVFPISSAAKGVGQEQGSLQTPSGQHRICAKIGLGLPAMSVFRGRRWTGEIFSPVMEQQYPGRDWILSRILWLDGLEPGLNRGRNQDSQRRFIYIHGTNEENKIGQPHSHGCIRMRNIDIISLFSLVDLGGLVNIVSR